MRSIEFTAYAVREYDVKYTAILDENDPMVQEMLLNNDMTFEDLENLDFVEQQDLWYTILSVPADSIKLEEDFSPLSERFIQFETFMSGDEND